MEHKYSKGDWSRNGHHIMISGKTGAQGQSYSQYFDLRRIGVEPKRDMEGEANAQLMATAPELLQALIDLKNKVRPQELFSPEFKKACEVIEKAISI